jgi:hypothetical protein
MSYEEEDAYIHTCRGLESMRENLASALGLTIMFSVT